MLLESATVAPPLPAACDRVAVQDDDAPELSEVGLQETEVNTAGPTNSTDVVCEPPFSEAVSVTVCPTDKVPAVAVKVDVVAPA